MAVVTQNWIIDSLKQNPEIIKKVKEEELQNQKLNFKTVAKIVTKLQSLQSNLAKKERFLIKSTEDYKMKIRKYEEKALRLEPVAENRIICIQNEQVKFRFSYRDSLCKLFA